MGSEAADNALPDGAHEEAASAFVERARSQYGADLTELYIFGSTARGEATGRSSDVDVLIVLPDGPAEDAIADSLRDITIDVMIEYGPVVELHILSESTFERYREQGNPFVKHALREVHMSKDDPMRPSRTNYGKHTNARRR